MIEIETTSVYNGGIKRVKLIEKAYYVIILHFSSVGFCVDAAVPGIQVRTDEYVYIYIVTGDTNRVIVFVKYILLLYIRRSRRVCRTKNAYENDFVTHVIASDPTTISNKYVIL